MKPIETGQIVEELDSRGDAYRVWSCDEFACDSCGVRVVMRFGNAPLAEHYQVEAYATVKSRAAYQLR